jgi:hypothetical protein
MSLGSRELMRATRRAMLARFDEPDLAPEAAASSADATSAPDPVSTADAPRAASEGL